MTSKDFHALSLILLIVVGYHRVITHFCKTTIAISLSYFCLSIMEPLSFLHCTFSKNFTSIFDMLSLKFFTFLILSSDTFDIYKTSHPRTDSSFISYVGSYFFLQVLLDILNFIHLIQLDSQSSLISSSLFFSLTTQVGADTYCLCFSHQHYDYHHYG